MEAVSIISLKSNNAEDVQENNSKSGACTPSDFISFSPKDLEFVVKFFEEHGSDVFCTILHSLCPSIYGHELVKGTLSFILLVIYALF